MRYLKWPGLTVRIPNTSIESADYIMSRWKDNDKAFKSIADRLGAELEALSEWKEVVYNNKPLRYIKIKVKMFWEPFVGPLQEFDPDLEDDSRETSHLFMGML